MVELETGTTLYRVVSVSRYVSVTDPLSLKCRERESGDPVVELETGTTLYRV